MKERKHQLLHHDWFYSCIKLVELLLVGQFFLPFVEKNEAKPCIPLLLETLNI